VLLVRRSPGLSAPCWLRRGLQLPRGLGVERVGVRGTPSSLCVQPIATNRSSAYEKVLTSFCCEKNWNFLFVLTDNLSFVFFL
jgi:hypothetical protein